MRRHVYSKWAKTIALNAHSNIRKYVPITKRLNKESLKQMLEQYGMVYIKPDTGTFGNGVMRVEWNPGENGASYKYQSGLRIKRFHEYSKLYASIRKDIRKRNYLVQKGIHLLKYKGNRFDLRVMVQQDPNRKWETTGVIGRVAHPRKIVTNFHNGGTLKSVDQLLGSYLSSTSRQRYVGKLKSLGLDVAKAMHKKYRGIKEIGLDVALDKELNPWILEVNTSPDPFIFRRLKDKSIFAKIVRYAKRYKRL
ncbi:YheC/YheD family protein [Paenibacillus eucommiae]|uniref:Glutathione synthase/RimK-type ligase-like ATP-grasp enzyme n=1 Tax=Paenibacillus eucommiae TaxID=1355755 RepID=A0ABS4IZF7_9BACL|nr:YheC/YheD family protein [Paenibacillus eucommiae]MBP1992967.1 glutathione synthase/RimK-type ligase-like ATP-grasp enzyme [Paenibacillus eucommiae]